MTPLQRKVLAFSYTHGLAHLSSTMSAAPIIEYIHKVMGPDGVFILSQGHAAIALYCHLGRAKELYEKWGMHPHRDPEAGIYCSTGSLGMGITVALGAAMAGREVHVLISDGEAAEGCVWEALRLGRDLHNLKVYLNMNGYGALGPVDPQIHRMLSAVFPRLFVWRSYSAGVKEHYAVLTKAEYEALCAEPSVD